LETYGGTTDALEMWDKADILSVASRLGVDYKVVLMTGECLGFVLARSGTSDGASNVGATGISIGNTNYRLGEDLRGLAATLKAAVPALTFADALALVRNRVPIKHFFSDAGIAHSAAVRGLDGETPAGLLQLVLSCEGGRLPSPSKVAHVLAKPCIFG
jgi:hypothetical protein